MFRLLSFQMNDDFVCGGDGCHSHTHMYYMQCVSETIENNEIGVRVMEIEQ